VETELSHTRSEFEAAFRDLCDRYGLPRPIMNTQVEGFEVDAYWAEHNLVVELDSWGHHGTRAAFERDRERSAELDTHGYRVLRFTYTQVMTRQGWVASRLAPRFRRGSSSSRRSAA
jgi:very-short-patch-repair endonuclease